MPFQNGGYLLLEERICSCWGKFFSLRDDPIKNVGKKENDRVVSLDSVFLHIKSFILYVPVRQFTIAVT